MGKTLRASTTIAIAAVATACAVGCSAAPADEATGSEEAALCKTGDCSSGSDYACYYTGYLSSSDVFENDLRALGCGGTYRYKKQVTGVYNGDAYWATFCSSGATVYGWCPASGSWETMSPSRLADCYHSVAPYWSSSDTVDQCTGRASSYVWVDWDPNCAGPNCYQ